VLDQPAQGFLDGIPFALRRLVAAAGQDGSQEFGQSLG
jgi:hypothetical protein